MYRSHVSMIYDTDTVQKMYHDTWYLILFLYQDTYHDRPTYVSLILPNTGQARMATSIAEADIAAEHNARKQKLWATALDILVKYKKSSCR